MDRKRFIIQVLVGIVLFTVISVILERDYSDAVWIEKLQYGLIFGLVYGMYLWARERYRK